MHILKEVNLADFTTFKVASVAKRLLIIETPEDLIKLQGVENLYVLGHGSNILITDRLDTVVKLGPKFPSSQMVHKLCASFAKQGKSGLEFLMGIPATLGGAIKMNAGGSGGCMADVIKSVDIFDGTFHRHKPLFKYRDSDIPGIILNAEFKNLKKDDPEKIKERMKQTLIEKKLHQPLSSRTAGCVFKNSGTARAGILIERCGLKGKRIGGATVSAKHANFIETAPGATSDDVLLLINYVHDTVYKATGVNLELEIKIWPEKSFLQEGP